jgi:hypothetical protein
MEALMTVSHGPPIVGDAAKTKPVQIYGSMSITGRERE